MGCDWLSVQDGIDFDYCDLTPATTVGSYIFTVTGTDSADTTITASTKVTITVQ